ncbi:type V secretion protein A [Yersinia pseudotuberculosis]|uniref:Autotransporter protein n=1 Tax=Yersinia pseudotuberculosis TaxID=633 RepID=A0A380QEP8_YERPU|nr:autotransporter outer membrane beta-barrel domain-containing protein [Yersinia pseudotuberculosis]PSH17928.1 type V secretion protein A [Yersinia pseudotuberculosis]SUP86833.1 autotransporter protein [Yersinia pseudotuberculosis]
MKIHSLALLVGSVSLLAAPTLYAVTIDGGQIVTVPETDSSPWDINDVLIVGDLSNGTLKINDNGMVNAIAGYIGYSAGATGIVDISGAEARWNNTGNLTVGRYGDGSLTINEGGVASSAGGYIGSQTGATGAVDVSGAGSLWNNSANLFVGQFSNGTLTISEAGVVNNTHGYIGYGDQSTGVVNVSGAGSQWNNSDTLSVGQFGNGTLTVSEGGVVNNRDSTLGYVAGATGVVNVSGVGSQWNNDGILTVGLYGNGSLTVSEGGVVSSIGGYIGTTAGSMGFVDVSGVGSQWNNSDTLVVGDSGSGILTIREGGVVNNRDSYIGNLAGQEGIIDVSGVGSQWNNDTILNVGNHGNGALIIRDGGVVNNRDGYIGYDSGSVGVVTVTGAGSQWNNSTTLAIGTTGNGTLTIADEAEVSASTVTLALEETSSGTLNIGNGHLAGTLNTASITGGDGAATLNFNHTDDIDFTPLMTGSLTVNHLNQSVTTLMSANDYTGVTTVSAGTLQAGTAGAFSHQSDFIIEAGGQLDLAGYDQTLASLSNSGTVLFNGQTDNYTAREAGTAGTSLTITGNYHGQGGLLVMNTQLGGDGSLTDHLTVMGEADGQTYVQVTNAGGSGAATLNGIELITVRKDPNGPSTDAEFIQSGRIVAGAYDYTLDQGLGNLSNNWYLNSFTDSIVDPEEQIERPETGAYSANLAAANNLFVTRLHDRLGETQYIDALTGERKVTSLWLRNEGGHNRSRSSNDQLNTQANRYVMQLGGDIAQWSRNAADRFHLGIMAGYANSSSNTVSQITGYNAKGSIDGYSMGVYGTWYANETNKTGLYVDTWAQYSWFNNTVDGQDLATEEYKSKGVTASIESGYTFKIGENVAKNATYFIQPKAQVTWMGVKADDHKEANGTNVSGEGDGNIQTRLGVKIFMNGYSEQDKGKDRVFQPFVEANWIHNTKDFSTTLDNVTIKQDGAANLGELKVGVEGQLNKELNLWGNVGQQVGNTGYSDTAVMLGVKYNF